MRRWLLALVVLTGCSAGEETGSSGAAVTVCGTTTVKGIDVYHGDNGGVAIDWNNVKSDGISFAFAKATESTNFTDPMFATNWAGMKAAGLVRGAYHFFHADVDGALQASFFLSTVGTLEPGDLVALDLETANNQSQATIVSRAEAFLSAVQKATGTTPLLYVSPAFLSSYTGFGSYYLWIANYGVSCPDVPSAWSTYTFWQSTGSGSLSALSGSVDLDSFNGTLTQLESLGAPSPGMDAGAPPPDAGAPPVEAGADASTGSDMDASGTMPRRPLSGDGGSDAFTSSNGCSAGGGAPSGWLALGLAQVLNARRKRRSAFFQSA